MTPLALSIADRRPLPQGRTAGYRQYLIGQYGTLTRAARAYGYRPSIFHQRLRKIDPEGFARSERVNVTEHHHACHLCMRTVPRGVVLCDFHRERVGPQVAAAVDALGVRKPKAPREWWQRVDCLLATAGYVMVTF